MSPQARFRRGLLKCLYSWYCHSRTLKKRQIGTLGRHTHLFIAIRGNSTTDFYIIFAFKISLLHHFLLHQFYYKQHLTRQQKDPQDLIKKQRRRTGFPCTLTLLKLHFLFIKQRRGEVPLRRIRKDCDNCFALSQLFRQLQSRRHIGPGGYAAHDSFFRGQLL